MKPEPIFKVQQLIICVLILLTSLCLRANPHIDEVIGKAKLYAANGIVEGVLKEFENYPDANKKMILFHSFGEFHSNWVVWAIGWDDKVMIGYFIGKETKVQKWNGGFYGGKKHAEEYKNFLKIFDSCRNHIKINRGVEPEQHKNPAAMIDFYLGDGNQKVFHERVTEINGGAGVFEKALKLESSNLRKILKLNPK